MSSMRQYGQPPSRCPAGAGSSPWSIRRRNAGRLTPDIREIPLSPTVPGSPGVGRGNRPSRRVAELTLAADTPSRRAIAAIDTPAWRSRTHPSALSVSPVRSGNGPYGAVAADTVDSDTPASFAIRRTVCPSLRKRAHSAAGCDRLPLAGNGPLADVARETVAPPTPASRAISATLTPARRASTHAAASRSRTSVGRRTPRPTTAMLRTTRGARQFSAPPHVRQLATMQAVQFHE